MSGRPRGRGLERLMLGCTIALALASGSAIVENRLLWGFWLHRPTLAAVVDGSGSIDAVSAVRFPPFAGTPTRWARRDWLVQTDSICRGANEACVGEQIAERVSRALEKDAALAEIDDVTLAILWESIRPTESRGVGPAGGALGWPLKGIVTALGGERAGRWFVLAYRTAEVANDRHAFVEALVEVDGQRAFVRDQVVSYYDEAGLEFVTLGFLWWANLGAVAVVLVVGAGIGRVWRRRSTATCT